MEEEYYIVNVFGNMYRISLDNYKKMNDNVLSLRIEYTKSNSDHLSTLLAHYLQLSEVGQTKVLAIIKDLAMISPKNENENNHK